MIKKYIFKQALLVALLGCIQPNLQAQVASSKDAVHHGQKSLKKKRIHFGGDLKRVPGVKLLRKPAGDNKRLFRLEQPKVQARKKGAHNRTMRTLNIQKKGKKARRSKIENTQKLAQKPVVRKT